MDMTISLFDAFIQRMPATRSMRMMDLAQAALYAQVTNEGRRNIWNSWANVINKVTHTMTMTLDGISQSAFTWNGEIINIKFLKQQFMSIFGRGSVEEH